MAEVNISLNGRVYEIACDAGQEGRIVDLAAYIDQRLQKIARSGGAYTDSHLLALAALVLADELFDARESAAGAAKPAAPAAKEAPAPSKEEEAALAKLLENLSKRIDGIAQRVQAA
ncbi:MAG TPA: cell division protein ZapA [Patescibacteria group bacterium]|nr:cell division protein ZapA [Patescibacteria group bacterium]